MADIHIRNVDAARYRELKRQAIDEGLSMKDLVLRLLGFNEDSDPSPYPILDAQTPNVTIADLNKAVERVKDRRPREVQRLAHAVGCKCFSCKPMKEK